MVLDDMPGHGRRLAAEVELPSVPFHILIDGSKHDFGNFHYYK